MLLTTKQILVNAVRSYGELLDRAIAVEQQVARSQPDLILTYTANDLDVDHREVHEAVMTVAQSPLGLLNPDVFSFEIPSSTEWCSPSVATTYTPQASRYITEHLQTKLEALELSVEEVKPWPCARSIRVDEHRAGWQGGRDGLTDNKQDRVGAASHAALAAGTA